MDGSDNKRGLLYWVGVCAAAALLLLVFNARTIVRSSLLAELHHLPLVYNLWPSPTPTPSPARLLISEVLYKPLGAEPEGEWLDVFNVGDFPLDLGAYKVGDEERRGGGEGMYRFPAGLVLAPRQVLLIVYRATAFRANYGFDPDYELADSDANVPDLEKYTAWASGALGLENGGDEVLVLDAADQVVEAVSWGSSAYAFDPPVPSAPDGHSLERYPAYQDHDSAGDWHLQPVPAPGLVDLTPPTPTPTPTRTPTPTPTPVPLPVLVLNEIHADPHSTLGDANRDGSADGEQDEFVEVVNLDGGLVDLSGWTLNDLVGVRHVFPPGTLLEHGCAVLVFGGGSPQGSFGGSLVQTASSGYLRLNNTGDRVALLAPDGRVALLYTYGIEGGDDQSLTRYPDLSGPDPLLPHSSLPGSGGALYSPGTRLDGIPFFGCQAAFPVTLTRDSR